jgi:hypothetical protein
MARFYAFILLIGLAAPGLGQDVSAFGNKANYGLSGRVNVGYNHFSTFGGQERFAPHGYSITGGLHGKLGAIDVPLSFTYTQLSRSISTPFNMFGASPYYKWAKLHLGHRNLNFSPLVFSGRTFLGAGVELTPGKFNFTAFSGNMQNLSVVRDSVAAGALVLPSFKRRIQGVRVGVQNRANKLELMGIRVVDLGNGASDFAAPPAENLVIGTNASLRLLKRLTLSLNGSASVFTSNQNLVRPDDTPEILARLDPLHRFNLSTRASYALEAAAKYNHKGYFLGLRYRRLDPFYLSLATNFLQNDLENITVDFGLPAFKNKLRLRGSLGQQRDNLRNHKAYTNRRLIGSATATFIPGKQLQIMGRYANYQQESQSGLVEVNDTFRILTITHSIYFNTQWKIVEDDVKAFSVGVNYFNNNVIDEAARSFRSQDNNFTGTGVNGRVSYHYKPKGISFGPVFNYNVYEFAAFSQGRVGAGLHLNKSFLDKKINTGLQLMRQQNLFNGKSNGYNSNISLNARAAVTRKQSLGLRMMYLNNESVLTPSFQEFRANIVYGYGF